MFAISERLRFFGVMGFKSMCADTLLCITLYHTTILRTDKVDLVLCTLIKLCLGSKQAIAIKFLSHAVSYCACIR
ncbi:hypothetical protein KDA_12750 [Dictyobacter alpinus]|uniref:Uncharacterized protein n=1 Tax=Dictyobacter alpinus TaxID=2014873 RepID=A0A402B363_9CHLR|nr:hypothetical protein KDA_12750 [Dictyobacter alpinus]